MENSSNRVPWLGEPRLNQFGTYNDQLATCQYRPEYPMEAWFHAMQWPQMGLNRDEVRHTIAGNAQHESA
jgi:hypothetical protein